MQDILKDNEFLSPEYESEVKHLPFAQVINDKHKDNCGFFITVDNLGAADWQLAAEQQYHTTIWQTGEEAQGLLIQSPRLLILAQSPLMMFERSTRQSLGVFNIDYYRNARATTLLKTKYLVYFVDQDNQLRHQLPMQLTLKGANGASFGEHLRSFRSELEAAFALACDRPKQRRSDKFHALGVFCARTEPQLKGEGQESAWICATTSHEKPSAENFLSYFVGFTPLKHKILSEVEQNTNFGKPKLQGNASLELPATPPQPVAAAWSEFEDLHQDDPEISF